MYDAEDTSAEAAAAPAPDPVATLPQPAIAPAKRGRLVTAATVQEADRTVGGVAF